MAARRTVTHAMSTRRLYWENTRRPIWQHGEQSPTPCPWEGCIERTPGDRHGSTENNHPRHVHEKDVLREHQETDMAARRTITHAMSMRRILYWENTRRPTWQHGEHSPTPCPWEGCIERTPGDRHGSTENNHPRHVHEKDVLREHQETDMVARRTITHAMSMRRMYWENTRRPTW